MTAASPVQRTARAPSESNGRPLTILSEIAPLVVPALYQFAEHTWPRETEIERKRFGIVGSTVRVKAELPPRYRIVLRRYDLATLDSSWRLEAGGPVDLFEWDESGRVTGFYGFRYHVLSISPVYDELGHPAGFAINGRPSNREDGALSSIDARIDTTAFVRSTDPTDLISTLRLPHLVPRIEEVRPGMAPTAGYANVLRQMDKRAYLTSRGVNEYVSPGWTPDTLRKAFEHPAIRALWIADPSGPSATPKPEHH